MSDQAENLRRRFSPADRQAGAKTIGIISGKGGVGKSNFSLNFSLSLVQQGKRVLLLDMDIGMGNIDILMGRHSEFSIIDFFEGGMPLRHVIASGPEGLSILAGGSGLTSLVAIDEASFERFTEEFRPLIAEYDYILFDMGAGISKDSSKLLLCVDELMVIVTPEPTSVMDAYSAMKYLSVSSSAIPFYLVCNRAADSREGRLTIQRLENAMKKFMNKDLLSLGYLPDDRTVSRAVTSQTPFLQFDPKARVSIAIKEIANRYIQHSIDKEMEMPKTNFLNNLKRYFRGRQA